MQEILLDQLPILADLQRYLEHLSMMDPPPVKQDFILEQVCNHYNRYSKHPRQWNSVEWKLLSVKLSSQPFCPAVGIPFDPNPQTRSTARNNNMLN